MMKMTSILKTGVLFLGLCSASAALAIECVPYAKKIQPGGYNWDGLFPKIVNGKPTTTKCTAADEGSKCARWYAGKELGNSLYAPNKGKAPKVGAMMIFNAFDRSTVGHVAVVTKLESDGWIRVMHANFDIKDGASAGYYKINADGSATYRTARNVVWQTTYPFAHFVYNPNY